MSLHYLPVPAKHLLIVSLYSLLIPGRHLLIVFGGVKGLEAAVEADDNLDIENPSELFQYYLNTCPGQGSGTIRTEVGKLHRPAPMKYLTSINSRLSIVQFCLTLVV